MPDRPAVFRQPRRPNAGNAAQVSAQVVRILTPSRRFLHQLVELLHQDHGLKLLHPVVAAAGEELPFALEAPAGASDVVEGVAAVQKFITVAGDGAAFAGRNMFRVLETETGEISQRAALAAFVLGQPGLAGVFDHGEFVFAGNRVDRVHSQGIP
jgi:hypothetical protein